MESARSIVDDIIEDIVEEKLGIDSLEEQGRDTLDFHDVHVLSLREALLEAFDAGYKMCSLSRG